jgi:DNA-binding LacI/PurR family transcriptional regulator
MCLTTVSQRKYEMGDLAVQILTQSIEQKKPATVHRVILEPELIVRESSCFLNGGALDITNCA